jgi:molybdopterin-guanine dinucleotide biosynthesis protein A
MEQTSGCFVIMEKKKNILKGIVLAGGQSKRFGENKALAKIDGKTLIGKSLSLLESLGLDTAVVTSAAQSYDFLSCSVLKDRFPDKGPLGGIYTALEEFPCTLLVLTCDMPAMTNAVLKALVQVHQKEKKQATVFQRKGDFFQPFPGVYEFSLFPEIKKRLNKNELSMQSFLKEVSSKQCIAIDDSDEAFLNINTRKDLLQFNPTF